MEYIRNVVGLRSERKITVNRFAEREKKTPCRFYTGKWKLDTKALFLTEMAHNRDKNWLFEKYMRRGLENLCGVEKEI